MKRIIFVTPAYSFFTPAISQALKNLKFQVKTFDNYKPNSFTRFIGLLATFNFISRKKAQTYINQIANQKLLKLSLKFKPDYLITTKAENISVKTLKVLKKQGVSTINWFGDGLFFWSWMKKTAPYYTVFLNCCKKADKKLNSIGVKAYYLPYAAHISKPLKKLPQKYDITFCGQHTKRREKFLKVLRPLNLKIFGFAHWQTTALKDIASGPVSIQKVAQICAQSKIVVNLLTGTDKTEPDEINIRTFEALGNKAFLLVHDRPALYRHFTPQKDFVTFKTPQDLFKKAKYYLTHPKERNKIAAHGFQTVKKRYTYEIQLKKLFNIVKNHEH